MENIKIATVCGLCAGCKYAINTAKSLKLENDKVVLFKEIVHNENVNSELKSMGISIKNDINELCSDEIVLIRAHGEPKSTFDYLDSKNIHYSDCTCINVKKIHNLVNDFSRNGFINIIIGKCGKNTGKIHPEVLGTMGWATTNEVILIEDEEDLSKLENFKNKKFYLTCQTTFNEAKADVLIEKITKILEIGNNLLHINKSICNAQKVINQSAKTLAENCNLMLVVGSKTSSNTTELFNNLKPICKTVFIDNIENWKNILENENIKISKETKIGITAGASTDPKELKNLKLKIEGEICQTI